MSLPLPLRLRLHELQRFSVHTNEEAAEIEAFNRVTELIHAAREIADENTGLAATIIYHHDDDDDVGSFACCGVVSYAPHTGDCPAVRLRAALAPFKETTT